LDGAADGRGGGADENGVAGRVDDEVEALVGVEADQEGDGVVAEDVDVRKVEVEGGARGGACVDVEPEAAEGGGGVVAESVVGGEGAHGAGGGLGVAAEPRVADDVPGRADVGDGGGNVGFLSFVDVRDGDMEGGVGGGGVGAVGSVVGGGRAEVRQVGRREEVVSEVGAGGAGRVALGPGGAFAGKMIGCVADLAGIGGAGRGAEWAAR